jgi:hypothetical protein
MACAVPLLLCCKSGLRYVKYCQSLRRTMILKKRAGYVQAILATIQFRMLHVLIYKAEICSFHIVWVWNLVSYVKRRTQIEGLWEQGGEENVWWETEVGVERCRRICSELHVCYSSADITNIFVARKVIYMWHAYSREGIQSLLRKPEQEEPLWRHRRIL